MVRLMMGTSGIQIDRCAMSGANLACRRGGRVVFARLSFAIESGDLLVLRGANGSGKTTLLRLMAGLARPYAGTLSWNGAPLDGGIGARARYVGHLDAIKPALSVQENLAFWSRIFASPAADVMPALGAFGIAHLSALPARLLSAGQRHRLALARVLQGRPALWLLDEPANTLDDAGLSVLRDLIARQRANGGMVVIASHGEALGDNPKTIVLNDFRPVRADLAQDSAHEIAQDPAQSITSA
jgi:heme exporter protein A